ncbi:uncharacterized protein LOC127158516 [Labeo rohita]|uniref:uncharacterized protein LOC127158516 n=1 Tax=Labeo rohita TaxID=84645 RepID=UPI0021E2C8A7|nr:uncharacterized protein LOC127158516 [Labeo rohita]
MAYKCHMCLLRLIILCLLLTGSSGMDDTHVFCSSGKNVHLPCNNAVSDCTSTAWMYTRHSGAVELIVDGIKKENTERHERLSLGSDCSLNIKKVTKKDYGFYTCRQYVNGKQQGTDARVYLHFLNVPSSSSQTEIRPGSSVTLSCQLYIYGITCETLVRFEGIQLIWVNQTGVNLQTDSRYQISFSSTHCNSTLTTTLLNEDHNREWRCQVIQRNKVKTSVKYTVKYSVSSSNSEKKSSKTTAAAPTQQDKWIIAPNTEMTSAVTTEQLIVIIVEIAVFAVPTVILLQIICARRAGRKNSHHQEEIKIPTVLQRDTLYK